MVDASGIARPGKIIALHLNFPSRIAQRGRAPVQPGYFLKPVTSMIGSGEIERPAGTELLAFEGEIAIIIGRTTRRVTPEKGWAAVSGVTASNDFGVYDLRHADAGSNLKSKGGDGFTPIGPTVIPASTIKPDALRLRTWVNGELVQDDTTADLVFPFGRLVADLSQLMTLEKGDIILTGTPAGSTVVDPGDTVEVEVDAPDAPGAPTSGRLVTTVSQGTIPLPAFGAQPKIDDAERAEAWGSREAAGLPGNGLTAELRAKVDSVGTATLSAQLRKRGMNAVTIDGVRSSRPGARMVGTARTLRYVPFREDLFEAHGNGYNAQKRAFDSLRPGEVLVIEARGDGFAGTLGDVLAKRAEMLGAAGIVTDGAVRDVVAVSALAIPTYHAAAHPAVLGRRHVPWSVDDTIACGGATVQSGDIVVGDADGVLVIPRSLLESVVDDAIAQEAEEQFILEQVSAGESVNGLYPLNAQWRERYEAEGGAK